MDETFEFLDTMFLENDEIFLMLIEMIPTDSRRQLLPTYVFNIMKTGSNERVGEIELRVGMNEKTMFYGNIGYSVTKRHRGHRYAAKACALIEGLAIKHGMPEVVITCDPDNYSSRRTCEIYGAEYVKDVTRDFSGAGDIEIKRMYIKKL